MEARGGKPFSEDQLPRAVIRFKQGVGRLIRSHRDSGRVVILDPRIVSKGYGRRFLEALPAGVRLEYGSHSEHFEDDSQADDFNAYIEQSFIGRIQLDGSRRSPEYRIDHSSLFHNKLEYEV